MCNGWNHPDGCDCGFGPPYDRDVADYFDQRVGGEGGRDLSSAGPYSRELRTAIRNDLLTTQLASTFLWQSYIGHISETRRKRPGKTVAGEEQLVVYVIRHGRGYPRHDLLIFDPAVPPGEIRKGIAEISSNELRNGWRNYRAIHAISEKSTPKWLSGLRIDDVPEIGNEAKTAQNHFFIAIHPPHIVWTSAGALTLPSIASMPLQISKSAQGGGLATAGVVSADDQGRFGVTTALHAVADVGASVYVTGILGNIRSRDVITDSCFIEVEHSSLPACKSCPGPLSGVTPGVNEKVNFHGATSGKVETVIIGWTPELPWYVPGSQSKILTPAVTNGGDSGAALINQGGHVVGFAHYRTAFSTPVSHSAWIWAESVFAALHLQ